MQQSPRILSLFFLAAASSAALAQEGTPSSGAPEGAKDGTHSKWARPEPIPPSTPSVAVKARLAAAPAPGNQGSPYVSLRALSTKEGEASLQTAEGPRTLRPGDRLGADVVKAVGEGRLVLFRSATPGRVGGDATVVIRFDAAGQPSVRIYHNEDPTRLEPRQAQ